MEKVGGLRCDEERMGNEKGLGGSGYSSIIYWRWR
jgi:hypothetical protein